MTIAHLQPLGRRIRACGEVPPICLEGSQVQSEPTCLLLELPAGDSDRQGGVTVVATAHIARTATHHSVDTYVSVNDL
jgi:hypothetical protein